MTKTEAKVRSKLRRPSRHVSLAVLRVGDAVVWTGPRRPGPIQSVVTSRSRWPVGITWADGVEQVEPVAVESERLTGVARAR
jgi:hypothetical protein